MHDSLYNIDIPINNISSSILERCISDNSISDIAEELSLTYDASYDEILEDAEKLCGYLKKCKILECKARKFDRLLSLSVKLADSYPVLKSIHNFYYRMINMLNKMHDLYLKPIQLMLYRGEKDEQNNID